MPAQESDEKVKTVIKKEDLKIGQKVKYHPIGNSVHLSEGIVKEIITQPEIVGDSHRRVKASEDNPRVVIENLHTHKRTAYRITSVEEILEDAKEENRKKEPKEMERDGESEEPEEKEPEGEESDNESQDPDYDPAKGNVEIVNDF
ncbi:4209_t:CDS:2 [Dentiscutata heterogama]|uniref:4209_t:CDS:1 n=1 Tax=Dentiscutata heterogama TaxID=1316150 RepID=A0ACA9NJE4_9GLOM|nr:4209_t:CDS:2 [Dentiscutata heterogama]